MVCPRRHDNSMGHRHRKLFRQWMLDWLCVDQLLLDIRRSKNGYNSGNTHVILIHIDIIYIFIIIYAAIFRSVPFTCINISYQYIFLCHRVFITFTSIQAIDRQNMRTDKSRPIIIFHVRYVSSEWILKYNHKRRK